MGRLLDMLPAWIRRPKTYVTWVWSEPNSDIGQLLWAVRARGLRALVQPRSKGDPNRYVEEFVAFAQAQEPLWRAVTRWFDTLPWHHAVRAWFTPRFPRRDWSFVYTGPDGRQSLPWELTEAQIAEWERFHPTGTMFVQLTVEEALHDFQQGR